MPTSTPRARFAHWRAHRARQCGRGAGRPPLPPIAPRRTLAQPPGGLARDFSGGPVCALWSKVYCLGFPALGLLAGTPVAEDGGGGEGSEGLGRHLMLPLDYRQSAVVGARTRDGFWAVVASWDNRSRARRLMAAVARSARECVRVTSAPPWYRTHTPRHAPCCGRRRRCAPTSRIARPGAAQRAGPSDPSRPG